MKRYTLLLLFTPLLFACQQSVKNAELIIAYPDIYPNYINVTIPASIAPMNFDIEHDDYDRIDVRVVGAKGGELHINEKQTAQFPAKKWAELLQESKGDSLMFTVAIRQIGRAHV